MHFSCFSDLQGSAAQLATSAAARILQGFRPSTLRQYNRMWTDFMSFQDQRIQLFLKSLIITTPLAPVQRPSLDVDILQKNLTHYQLLPHTVVFKALYVTCFFSFLRLSNILPHSIRTFDHTRQLAHGDFIPSHSGAVLVLKWSKTIQDRKTTQTIPLPNLGVSPLCPIAAITTMIKTIPVKPNDPLFILPPPPPHGFPLQIQLPENT